MRIMVLGAGGPAADNYIKSLRLADPDVYVLGVDTHPLMLELSCASETVCIDTRPSDDEFEDTAHAINVYDLVERYGITMVHAQPDQEARFLSMGWKDVPVSVPEMAVVDACQDKLECADLLGDLAPASRPWITPNGTRDHWMDVSMYNGAAFGDSMWMRARTGAGSLAAKRVDSFGDAMAWEKVWSGRVAPEDLMLAEVLPGEDRSYTGVWWKGEPVASACRVRVEYADTRTPSGQCSSPRIAKLDSRPETFDVAEKAIRRVSDATGTTPHGVFYVDMREAADGRLLVTEINAGRFNTTQNFYAEAGLNLPSIHAQLHHGTSVCVIPSRLEREDDYFWLRQPDMGHRLVTKTRVGV
jgi:hypothetical protein